MQKKVSVLAVAIFVFCVNISMSYADSMPVSTKDRILQRCVAIDETGFYVSRDMFCIQNRQLILEAVETLMGFPIKKVETR